MNEENIKIAISRQINTINDKGLVDAIKGIIFDSRNDINWNNAWDSMVSAMPEIIIEKEYE